MKLKINNWKGSVMKGKSYRKTDYKPIIYMTCKGTLNQYELDVDKSTLAAPSIWHKYLS